MLLWSADSEKLCLQLLRLLLDSNYLQLMGFRYWWYVFLIPMLDLSCSREQFHQRKSCVLTSFFLSLFQFTQNATWDKQWHYFREIVIRPVAFTPKWWEIMLHSVWEVRHLKNSTSCLLIFHFRLIFLNLDFWNKFILNDCMINNCTVQQYKMINWKTGKVNWNTLNVI